MCIFAVGKTRYAMSKNTQQMIQIIAEYAEGLAVRVVRPRRRKALERCGHTFRARLLRETVHPSHHGRNDC